MHTQKHHSRRAARSQARARERAGETLEFAALFGAGVTILGLVAQLLQHVLR